ncbi:hypothetical protein PQR66_09020 [Paraburkholderia agricolaris]|jgi:hypothetical protein|uniref:Cytochrome P460 n=1 Tax=Paraburkholderia agricolaris TaxID=2152888 RepID=A0ABW8ZIX0_9BURK
MIKHIHRFRTMMLTLLLVTGAASAQQDTADRSGGSPLDDLLRTNHASALNEQDKTSWLLFAYVTAPADGRGRQRSLFETWASDHDTFNRHPQWPGEPSGMHPHAAVLQAEEARRMDAAPGAHPLVSAQSLEEVRRNRSTFDFIVNNGLYTQEGLAAAFAAGKPIVFPLDSIEVKGDWIPADSPGVDATRYHITVGTDGKRYALASMHITTKLIPNWTWATFEHEDNAGRCDYIGCHDSFGATLPQVAPFSALGQRYPACLKSPALRAVFAKAGLDQAWQHYCLKGSQMDFTDSTGQPILLGNTIPEKGMVNTASCMTCHSRAAFGKDGLKTSEDGSLDPAPVASCPTGTPCSPNGAPNPDWFWLHNVPVAMQTDFVWAIPYCAVPTGQEVGPCG